MAVTTMEVSTIDSGTQDSPSTTTKRMRWWILFLSILATVVGAIGAPLLQRLYYMHGGNRKWLSTWIVSAGFPVLLPPLVFIYFKKLSQNTSTPKHFFMDLNLFFSGACLGVLMGLDNYMYSTGLSYLPLSTSSLLFSTQLVFTAVFAFFIVKQKFTFYSFNSVVLMTLGAVILAFHTSSDHPPGVTKQKYFIGFFLTLGAAALLGLSAPLIELSYRKSNRPITYMVLMQFQIVVNLLATIFATVGMLINKDFEAIPREASEYGIGEIKYYVVLVTCGIFWQIAFLGAISVIYYSSSLFSGIVSSLILPLTEVAAVIAFQEKFTGEKGMATALSLWGFASFFIGEYKKTYQPEPTIGPIEDYA